MVFVPEEEQIYIRQKLGHARQDNIAKRRKKVVRKKRKVERETKCGPRKKKLLRENKTPFFLMQQKVYKKLTSGNKIEDL